MTPGRIVAAIFGIVFGPIAIGLLVGGIALTIAFATLRDADEFLSSPDYNMTTSGFALVSDEVDLGSYPGDWWPSDAANVRFAVRSTDGGSVFVGIGPSDDVERYLDGVAHDQIVSLGDRRNEVTYRSFSGNAPATTPGEQSFWVATVEGQNEQTLTWGVRQGAWTVVVMNADGSAPVVVSTEIAVRIPALVGIGIGLIIAGLLLGALTAFLLVLAFRQQLAAASPAGQPETGPRHAGQGHTIYPSFSRDGWMNR